MIKTKVTLGPKASSFFDPSSRIFIRKGEVIELTPTQMNSTKIKNALNGGHLIMAVEIPSVNNEPELEPVSVDNQSLREKYINLFKAGKDLSKAFNREELQKIAEEFEIEVEKNDTKDTIIEAINGEIK